jgi:RNA polymerase-binding transcription factor DksA
MAKGDTSEDVKKTRYSDEELGEFRQIITEKLEKAREDLKMLTDAYTHANEHDTSDTSPTFKVLEEGYQVLSKEENSRLAARQQKFINSLENALIRIENKSYGICRATGKLISKERLRSVPHATLSIDAKLNQPQKR